MRSNDGSPPAGTLQLLDEHDPFTPLAASDLMQHQRLPFFVNAADEQPDEELSPSFVFPHTVEISSRDFSSLSSSIVTRTSLSNGEQSLAQYFPENSHSDYSKEGNLVRSSVFLRTRGDGSGSPSFSSLYRCGTQVKAGRSLNVEKVTSESNRMAGPLGACPSIAATRRAFKSQWFGSAPILNDYLLLKFIGRGSSGTVRLGYCLSLNLPVAIKSTIRPVAKRRSLGGISPVCRRIEAMEREVRVMKRLRHENVVSLYEVIDDPCSKTLYIVMQYIDKGPIAHLDMDGNCRPMDPDELVHYFQQILAALEHLQHHRIVHRDIKPENILISSNGRVFLADFGAAVFLDSEKSCLGRFEGTPLFMPPELFDDVSSMSKLSSDAAADGEVASESASKELQSSLPFPFAMDVWSLGVTLYTLLVGSVPFKSIGEIRAVCTRPVKLPNSIPETWRRLLEPMLGASPQQRATVSELQSKVKQMIANSTAQREAKVADCSFCSSARESEPVEQSSQLDPQPPPGRAPSNSKVFSFRRPTLPPLNEKYRQGVRMRSQGLSNSVCCLSGVSSSRGGREKAPVDPMRPDRQLGHLGNVRQLRQASMEESVSRQRFLSLAN
ncbi:putative serine/threonine protein kinase [Trypanosoma vivax]|nr:putative serine/threonine protein kinase [Trypanosoma vivax]